MKGDSSLKFGTFIPPIHSIKENPTLCIERDIKLVEHMDSLGYDEAWFGEHHSAGTELFASPELMILAAHTACLLYPSDAADEGLGGGPGGRRTLEATAYRTQALSATHSSTG